MLLNNGEAIFDITYCKDYSPWWYPADPIIVPENSATDYFFFNNLNAVYKTFL